ncbi:MAG: glycosyltransferase [Methylomonas sp.]|jgi:glycosyltransferase involved in cell wall biosynthesis
MNLKISVALASYNGAEYIREQLDSLNAQSYLPYELIITDDGSTDDTLETVNQFIKSALFKVSVIQNEERLGWKDNFLKAASLCSGDLIAFCDQDDLWLPNKLEIMSKEFTNPNVMLATHTLTVCDSKLKPIAIQDQGIKKTQLLPPLHKAHSPYFGLTLLFRRSLLEIGNLSERLPSLGQATSGCPHDQWLSFLGNVFGYTSDLNIPLVNYRQHGKNSVGYNDGSELRDTRKLWLDDPLLILNSDVNFFEARAKVCENISLRTLNSDIKNQAMLGHSFFSHLADISRKRIELLKTTNIFKRFLFFYLMLQNGNYLPNNRQGIGWKNALKDLIISVLRLNAILKNK